MSIAEFSKTLKDEAYKNWFARAAINIARDPVSKLRDTEQRSTRNSLLITKKTIEQVVAKLTGREPTQQELDTVYNDLRNVRINRTNKRASVIVDKDGSLYFPGINFDRIKRITDAGFKSIVTDKKLSDFFHRGHVYGLPTNIGYRTLENLAVSGVPEEIKEKLLLMLNSIVGELEQQDLASSNIKDSEYKLYAKYAKSRHKYLVELQIGAENAESGLDAAPIVNAIRRYFDPKNVFTIAKNLRTRPQYTFIQEIIESQGSPSYKSLVIADIVSSITGKPKNTKTYVIPETLVATAKVKFDNSEIKKETAKQKAIVNKLITKVRKLPVIKADRSLTRLEVLLRAKIGLQVRKNMGTGNARNILNYRTGRFAESVTIDRVTASKEGMISVFYDYMKHPYATFSSGGAQEYPKTRDPKLLISKSIREIGASIVGNRLRAVVV